VLAHRKSGGYMRKINKYFIAAVLVLVFMQFSAGLFAKTQKKIKMISTCGMIAQRYSYSKREKIPTVSPLEVVKAVPELREMAEIEIEEFSNINASLMTPQKMYDLAVSAWKTLKDPEVAGVVIIYGTETIEEAAFLTELLIDSEKPIVMTGAQRNPSDPSADGPANKSSGGRGNPVVKNEIVPRGSPWDLWDFAFARKDKLPMYYMIFLERVM